MSERRDQEQRRAIAALPDSIEESVLAALELDGLEQEAALRSLIRRSPQYRDAIAAWLAKENVPVPSVEAASTDAATASTSASQTEDDGDPPRRIGGYRILRLLGRGGFGSVFLAEDDAPEPRQFAIKVLNHDLNTKQFLRRFEAEREALQRMDHPGIAQMLKIGRAHV